MINKHVINKHVINKHVINGTCVLLTIGTVKTFQRGDIGKYGTLYEIIPKYDYRHKSHYQGCWKKSGKKKKKIEAQNVLPKNVYWPFKMNLEQYKVGHH